MLPTTYYLLRTPERKAARVPSILRAARLPSFRRGLEVQLRPPLRRAFLEGVVRQSLQARAVGADGEQVAVGLRLARQGDLLGRVAGPLAGEAQPLAVGREVRVVVPPAAADEFPQPRAVGPD